MTSMPASRRARAMTLAPRSCPSSPGFAMRTRIFRGIARARGSRFKRLFADAPALSRLGTGANVADEVLGRLAHRLLIRRVRERAQEAGCSGVGGVVDGHSALKRQGDAVRQQSGVWFQEREGKVPQVLCYLPDRLYTEVRIVHQAVAHFPDDQGRSRDPDIPCDVVDANLTG